MVLMGPLYVGSCEIEYGCNAISVLPVKHFGCLCVGHLSPEQGIMWKDRKQNVGLTLSNSDWGFEFCLFSFLFSPLSQVASSTRGGLRMFSSYGVVLPEWMDA